MKQAVVVSIARTAIGKAFRGSLNMTHGADMAAHVSSHCVQRAKIDPSIIEDSIWGCGYPEFVTGANIARQAVIRAQLPVSIAGTTVTRFCASGLQAIAMGAHAITQEGAGAVLVGGLESISQIQPLPRHSREPWIEANKPELYLPMIETADIVAKRYGISRNAQDVLAFESQQRTAHAQASGYFDNEIVPMSVTMAVKDKQTGELSYKMLDLTADECNRPSTTLEGLSTLEPVRGEDQFITAGNASQLSDGAAAMVMMDSTLAEKLGLQSLGAFKGFAVAGCEPDEMGIGPVFAVPRLLDRQGLSIDDIDLWELNEAFASQALYCRDKLGIDNEVFNVDGGAISIGHPFGMTGVRMAAHLLEAGRRRGARRGIVSMCVGGGQGAAGLFEIH